ncbi:MAG: hypothetical protein NZ822_01770 [Patescibacteria group bacterium]|nr:hypothetical protein [Patescibacteria group bacterium]
MKDRINLGVCFLLLFLGYSISQAITVGPAKIEFTVNPGETLTFNLFVRNDSEYDTVYFLSLEGFTEINGEKKFFVDPPEKNWFNFPTKINLSAKADVQIPVAITVPNDAPPGGHFLVIWVSSGAPQIEKGQVGIVGRVGALIFINVRGNAIYRAEVSKFLANRVAWSFPVKFSYIIKNNGNTYIRPTGYVDIKNILGKTVASLPINPKEFQILPNTEKTLETQWEGPTAFGIYRAFFNMGYGESSNLNFTYWFLFLNVKWLAIIFAIVIFIIFVLPFLVRKYNSWIIEKYKSRNE